MIEFTINEEPIGRVGQLAEVSIAYVVDRVFEPAALGEKFGCHYLVERRLEVPYVKNYDSIPQQGPACWRYQFDLKNWMFLAARNSGRLVGGAVIAMATEGVDMLEDRVDLAVLWDIRVLPTDRARGVGSALFRAAEATALSRGCRELKVETQNINVAACRFYAKQGCELQQVISGAYPDFPAETQMLWRKALVARSSVII